MAAIFTPCRFLCSALIELRISVRLIGQRFVVNRNRTAKWHYRVPGKGIAHFPGLPVGQCKPRSNIEQGLGEYSQIRFVYKQYHYRSPYWEPAMCGSKNQTAVRIQTTVARYIANRATTATAAIAMVPVAPMRTVPIWINIKFFMVVLSRRSKSHLLLLHIFKLLQMG